ncbi:MAG: hypothetical protein L6R40_000199 [Gallowayella cf. fulva]|nr:MAG: hypothetical protein L6R40_000199 [Xanthomendoza cf. fulva]
MFTRYNLRLTNSSCLLETKTLIIQILAKLVATPHGSVAFLVSKGWLVLSKFAVEEPLSLLIMNLAFGAAIEVTGNTSEIQSNIHETISEWIKVFPSHSTRLFEHVHSLLGHISINQYSNVPSWLLPLTRRLLWSSTSRYDDPSHSRLVINGLSAFLMKCYPNHFPELLYGQPPSNDLTVKSKPYSWLFIQLRLIDIRSSVPSLIEGSSLAGYEATKARLTGCYDLVSAFISFLVKCSDAMSDSDEGSDKLPFNPSLVLQIREDISNVCSLTIEYLCDRFEAMRASGANGQALPGNKTTLDRLNLAATNLGPESMAEDPLVRSQLTMLSLYLREDEGEMLRKEAGRMRNAIFWLYGRAPDLRYPLIMILEQFQYNPGGLGSIGDNDGWKVLVDDLVRIVRSHAPDSTMVTCGKTIVDLMGPVVSHAIEEGKSKDEWQQFARIAIQLKAKGSRELLDLKGSVALLAIDLMTMSPHTMSKATAELRKKLVMVPSRLLTARDKMDEETHHDLDAAVENLKMRSLGIV